MDGAFPSAQGEGFEQGAQWPNHKTGFRGNDDNRKTKLCMRWKNGHCRFGDQCNFAHGGQELRQLPPRRSSHCGSIGSHSGNKMGGAGSGQQNLGPSSCAGNSTGARAPEATGYARGSPQGARTWALQMDKWYMDNAGAVTFCSGQQDIQGGRATNQRQAIQMDKWYLDNTGAVAAHSRQQDIQGGRATNQRQTPHTRQGPVGWTEYQAQDGRFYYFNYHTLETTWNRPACWK